MFDAYNWMWSWRFDSSFVLKVDCCINPTRLSFNHLFVGWRSTLFQHFSSVFCWGSRDDHSWPLYLPFVVGGLAENVLDDCCCIVWKCLQLLDKLKYCWSFCAVVPVKTSGGLPIRRTIPSWSRLYCFSLVLSCTIVEQQSAKSATADWIDKPGIVCNIAM